MEDKKKSNLFVVFVEKLKVGVYIYVFLINIF